MTRRAGRQVRQAQVGLDERVQPVHRNWCTPRFQRPLHEPEMDRADHGGSALGQFKERAVPQSNLYLAVGCTPLGRKPELGEQADQPNDRLSGSRRLGLARRALEPAPPRTPGLERFRAGVAVTGQAEGEDVGEQLVTP
jgi:hypothetical protein